MSHKLQLVVYISHSGYINERSHQKTNLHMRRQRQISCAVTEQLISVDSMMPILPTSESSSF